MSNIDRLYALVRGKVPRCAYVRVPHWNLRSTWEAVMQEGEPTPVEREAIAAIFERFDVDMRELDSEQREGFAAQLSTPFRTLAMRPSLSDRIGFLEARLEAVIDQIEAMRADPKAVDKRYLAMLHSREEEREWQKDQLAHGDVGAAGMRGTQP